MNNDLIVSCDSVNNTVTLSSNMGVLTTLTWDIYEENTGFSVRNADFLMNVYCEDFYVLDEAAAIQCIMNIADMVCRDQDLDDIVFCNNQGHIRPMPPFIPCTIEDEELHVLPKQQLTLCKIWTIFQQNFGGYLCTEFLDDLIPPELRVGFIDLVNMELSLLRKDETTNE